MKKPKRKIVYVLTVSRYFPTTHPRAGEETHFPELIISGDKQHTVRGNYKLWKKRADKINAGLAVLSVRFWTGRPYASQQQEFLELSTINVQKVHVYQICQSRFDNEYRNTLDYLNGKNESKTPIQPGTSTHSKIFIDNKIIPLRHPFKFAAHDGLSLQDFTSWFKKALEDGACIIFNDQLKY